MNRGARGCEHSTIGINVTVAGEVGRLGLARRGRRFTIVDIIDNKVWVGRQMILIARSAPI